VQQPCRWRNLAVLFYVALDVSFFCNSCMPVMMCGNEISREIPFFFGLQGLGHIFFVGLVLYVLFRCAENAPDFMHLRMRASITITYGCICIALCHVAKYNYLSKRGRGTSVEKKKEKRKEKEKKRNRETDK